MDEEKTKVDIEAAAKECIKALLNSAQLNFADGSEAMRLTQAALNAAHALVAIKANNLLTN